MIWAILALLGVPLWLCAAGILYVVLTNRKLRKRSGDIPVRVKQPGSTRWKRGHAIWVSDVFAWRGSPAAWDEELVQVASLELRSPDVEEARKLRHLGDEFRIGSLMDVHGVTYEVATDSEHGRALLGPFAGTPTAMTAEDG
jgi:hypothetical protein